MQNFKNIKFFMVAALMLMMAAIFHFYSQASQNQISKKPTHEQVMEFENLSGIDLPEGKIIFFEKGPEEEHSFPRNNDYFYYKIILKLHHAESIFFSSKLNDSFKENKALRLPNFSNKAEGSEIKKNAYKMISGKSSQDEKLRNINITIDDGNEFSFIYIDFLK